MMKKYTSRLYSGIFLSFSLFASATSAQPLDVLLSDLINSHPRISAETNNLASAKSAIKEARAGYLPKVDVNASYGYENTDRTKLLVAAGEFDLNPANAGISISQNIFEGYRTAGSIDSAKVGLYIAEATLQSAEQQITLEAITNYLSVLKQVKLTALAKRNMKTLQDQLNLEDEKVQRGSGIAVDVLQAKSRLQISKERHTAFIGGLQDAISGYIQVFDSAPELTQLKLPTIPTQAIPETLEDTLLIAKNSNPLLKISHYGKLSAQHQKTISRAGYYPSVDFSASSNWKDDSGGIQGEELSSTAVVRATWQIFSGFADEAREEQAKNGIEAAASNAEDAERRIAQEVKLAWSNLNISHKRTELLDNAVNIAGEVYDARKRLRDAGSDTALNVLDAENELFRAQIDAESARFDYYTAVFRLLASMGTLDTNSL